MLSFTPFLSLEEHHERGRNVLGSTISLSKVHCSHIYKGLRNFCHKGTIISWKGRTKSAGQKIERLTWTGLMWLVSQSGQQHSGQWLPRIHEALGSVSSNNKWRFVCLLTFLWHLINLVCVCVTPAMVLMQTAEDYWWELGLSLYHVSPRS